MILKTLPGALQFPPYLAHPEFFAYPVIEIEAHYPVAPSPYRTGRVVLFHVNAKINNHCNDLGEAI